MNIWVYDIETYRNCFLVGFKNIKTGEYRIFEISDRKNQTIALYNFLTQEVNLLIGFNNLTFDYPVIHSLLLYKRSNPNYYYNLAQARIKSNRMHGNPLIPQLDMYRILHYNNKARRTSLKWCEFGLKLPNVADLPFEYFKKLENSEKDTLIEYLRHDLDATEALFTTFQDKIYIRNVLKREYGLDCLNSSDSTIGEQLILKFYLDYTGKSYEDVINLRTNRQEIPVKNIIFPYVKFKTKFFKDILKEVKDVIIRDTRNGFSLAFDYNDLEYHLKQGGIHASRTGKFISNDEYFIFDLDVAGFYPRLMIQNNVYPEHLGPEFITVLNEKIVTPRVTEFKPKSKDKELHYKQRKLYGAYSDAFKLAGNSVYGKSNDRFSFLCDPLVTMTTTINGELSLLMCIEDISEELDIQVLQANTDGFSLYMKREDEQRLREIVSEWEKTTGLTMEYQYYDKMFIRDVNNYLVDAGGYTKEKGAYEVEKKVGSEPALHKNDSMPVVQMAVREYLINNTDPEEFLKNHDNIYDFCIGKRAKKSKGEDAFFTYDYTLLENTKTVRYYITTNETCGILRKHFADGRESLCEAWPSNKAADKDKYWRIKLFNTYEELSDYEIDYSYYLREINKLISDFKE